MSSALLRLTLCVASLMDKQAAAQPAGAMCGSWPFHRHAMWCANRVPPAAVKGNINLVGAHAELSDSQRGLGQRGRLDASRGGERRYAPTSTDVLKSP